MQGNALFAGCGDSQIHEWDLNAMRCVRSFAGHADYVHCVALRENGQLVSGSEDGTVKLWGMIAYTGGTVPRVLKGQ